MVGGDDEWATGWHIVATAQVQARSDMKDENSEPADGMVEDGRGDVGFVEILFGFNLLVPVSYTILQMAIDDLQYLWDAEMIGGNDDGVLRLSQVVAVNIISTLYVLQHSFH